MFLPVVRKIIESAVTAALFILYTGIKWGLRSFKENFIMSCKSFHFHTKNIFANVYLFLSCHSYFQTPHFRCSRIFSTKHIKIKSSYLNTAKISKGQVFITAIMISLRTCHVTPYWYKSTNKKNIFFNQIDCIDKSINEWTRFLKFP